MAKLSGLMRCNTGHLFSTRKHGNVCPYCNVTVKDEEYANKAQYENGRFDQDLSYANELEVIDPVVGWLVCTEGPQKGRDYRIMAEKNFIGRADDMHIQILGDNRISRRNHAVIVYDPMNRRSTLLPGDSAGLVYLDRIAVHTPILLENMSTIQMGNSQFVFVELCGDNFEWENEVNSGFKGNVIQKSKEPTEPENPAGEIR